MPWEEVSVMSQRREFVSLALAEGANISELCRRFGISRDTAYRCINRFKQMGEAGLEDGSRRPHTSPFRTSGAMEGLVLWARDCHKAWGPRKLRPFLARKGRQGLPSPSTIAAILGRHGCVGPTQGPQHRPFRRFERKEPNELWQMDFKGYFPTAQGPCYPLSILDDHSRYAIGLEACSDEQGSTVKGKLVPIFQRFGLPQAMLMDTGSPWPPQGEPVYTSFEVWLMQLGIKVYHGRPFHPQTQGKDERFHKTLKAEVLQGRIFRDLLHAQEAFDGWRPIYNEERPHESLKMDVPAKKYHISAVPFPEELPLVEYSPGDVVRKVQVDGTITFHSIPFRVGHAFRGLPVALRPTGEDGVWDLFFLTHKVAQFDLTNPKNR
jgi:transposase InsO family protein